MDDTNDLVRWRLGALPISSWGYVTAQTAVSEACVFLLYVGNPFFFYPHKALMCLLCGSPYQRSYRHFRSAHSKSLNIVVHLICLCYAVLANSVLLRSADQYWFPDSIEVLSLSTLLMSACLLLFRTPSAPIFVKLAAVAVLVCGYSVRDVALTHWKSLLLFDGMMQAVNLKLGDAKAVPTLPHCWFVVLYTVVFVLQYILGVHFSGVLVPNISSINLVISITMVIGAIRPFYHHYNCYWIGYLGWVVAVLTDQPWLYCLGAGYGASLMQGVAHDLCLEAANLPELAKRSGNERAGDEIAHVSFFPVLILHSAYESAVGVPEK